MMPLWRKLCNRCIAEWKPPFEPPKPLPQTTLCDRPGRSQISPCVFEWFCGMTPEEARQAARKHWNSQVECPMVFSRTLYEDEDDAPENCIYAVEQLVWRQEQEGAAKGDK